ASLLNSAALSTNSALGLPLIGHSASTPSCSTMAAYKWLHAQDAAPPTPLTGRPGRPPCPGCTSGTRQWPPTDTVGHSAGVHPRRLRSDHYPYDQFTPVPRLTR